MYLFVTDCGRHPIHTYTSVVLLTLALNLYIPNKSNLLRLLQMRKKIHNILFSNSLHNFNYNNDVQFIQKLYNYSTKKIQLAVARSEESKTFVLLISYEIRWISLQVVICHIYNRTTCTSSDSVIT